MITTGLGSWIWIHSPYTVWLIKGNGAFVYDTNGADELAIPLLLDRYSEEAATPTQLANGVTRIEPVLVGAPSIVAHDQLNVAIVVAPLMTTLPLAPEYVYEPGNTTPDALEKIQPPKSHVEVVAWVTMMRYEEYIVTFGMENVRGSLTVQIKFEADIKYVHVEPLRPTRVKD